MAGSPAKRSKSPVQAVFVSDPPEAAGAGAAGALSEEAFFSDPSDEADEDSEAPASVIPFLA